VWKKITENQQPIDFQWIAGFLSFVAEKDANL